MRRFNIDGHLYREVRAEPEEELGYLESDAQKVGPLAETSLELIYQLRELDLPDEYTEVLAELASDYSDLEYTLGQLNKRMRELVEEGRGLRRLSSRTAVSLQQLQTQQRYLHEQPSARPPEQAPKQPGRVKRWLKKILNFPEEGEVLSGRHNADSDVSVQLQCLVDLMGLVHQTDHKAVDLVKRGKAWYLVLDGQAHKSPLTDSDVENIRSSC